jgi:hypothetical protein
VYVRLSGCLTESCGDDAEVVFACRDLAPAAIVEIVTFIALLQMLHRVQRYYAV